MSFSDFNLPFNLSSVLKQHNIREPFPIQEKAIPKLLRGDDVLGIAQTGSGKTLTYVLPVLTLLNTYVGHRNRHPYVLVLVPTRELALQVNEVVKLFIDPNRNQNKTMVAHGGTSKSPQMKQMSEVKVLIATPGRLLDLLNENAVSLSGLKMLVIDEADKLLNSDFKNEINEVLQKVSPKTQKVLFSATMSPEVQHLKKLMLNDAHIIQLEPIKTEKPKIEQQAYSVSAERKGPFLRYLIKQMDVSPVLIFTSSIKEADKVVDKLNKNKVAAKAIHSKKSQHARNTALELFKNGDIKVLVATDLLSRGIDIDALPYVVNYQLPRSPKDFIHRIGRTGRAGQKGKAISLISSEEESHFSVIQKKMNVTVELKPTDDYDLHGF